MRLVLLGTIPLWLEHPLLHGPVEFQFQRHCLNAMAPRHVLFSIQIHYTPYYMHINNKENKMFLKSTTLSKHM